jgi:hypothetical protein
MDVLAREDGSSSLRTDAGGSGGGLRGNARAGARSGARRTTFALCVLVASGCVADVDVDESRLGAPRLLAVRSEPAEASPNDAVRFVGLYAGAGGVATEAPIEWGFCTARRPLAELGPIARVCLERDGGAIAPIGVGLEVGGAIPSDACRLFGPEPPPAMEGASVGRPVDPDATGGYFQPLAIFDGDRASLFEQRIGCGAFGATQEQAAELTRRYRPNGAPAIDALEAIVGGEVLALGDEAIGVPAGRVVLSARWASCPASDACGDGVCGIDDDRGMCAEDCAEPRTCTGAERYLRFDLASRALMVEKEWLRVSWYTSAGTLELERTGVESENAATSTKNALDLASGEEALVIAVLRDSRGGASWRTARLAGE